MTGKDVAKEWVLIIALLAAVIVCGAKCVNKCGELLHGGHHVSNGVVIDNRPVTVRLTVTFETNPEYGGWGWSEGDMPTLTGRAYVYTAGRGTIEIPFETKGTDTGHRMVVWTAPPISVNPLTAEIAIEVTEVGSFSNSPVTTGTVGAQNERLPLTVLQNNERRLRSEGEFQNVRHGRSTHTGQDVPCGRLTITAVW